MTDTSRDATLDNDELLPLGALTADRGTSPETVLPRRGRDGRGRQLAIDIIARTSAAFTMLLLVADCIVVILSVIYRYFLNDPLYWSDDLATLLLVTITFVGSAVTSARGQHLGINLWSHRLGARVLSAMAGFQEAVIASIMMIVAYGGYQLCELRFPQQSTGLPITQAAFDLPVLVGGVLLVAIAVLRALATSISFLAFVLTGVAVYLLLWLGHPVLASLVETKQGDLIVAVVLPAALILLGVPMAFALGWGALAFFLGQPGLPLSIFAQRLEAAVNSSILLAVPFFILAGNLMAESGMAKKLVDFLATLFRPIRGSLGVVMIAAMLFFSGISGSKTADMAAVGGVMLPAIRDEDDGPDGEPSAEVDRAAALLAASGAMAETVPPAIAMLVLGSITSISVGSLFLAGILPAVFIAILLTAYVIWQGGFSVGEAVPYRLRSILGSGVRALTSLLMPLVLVVPILWGIATPTEASSFSVGYGAIAGVADGDLTWRKARRALSDSINLTAAVSLVIAGSSTVGYVLVVNGIPQQLAAWLAELHVGQIGYLLLLILVFLIISPIFEGLPPIIIFGPLLLPTAVTLNVDPLQFGVVLILATGIGVFLPPFGVGLFTAAAIGQTTMQRLARPALKYMSIVAAGTILVAIVPWFSLWLPHLLGHK